MAQRHRVRSSLSRTLLTSAVLAAMTAPAFAHGDASGAPQTLDKVVVTASGFEQKVVDAPASISVVSREGIGRASCRERGYAPVPEYGDGRTLKKDQLYR